MGARCCSNGSPVIAEGKPLGTVSEAYRGRAAAEAVGRETVPEYCDRVEARFTRACTAQT